MKKFGLIGFPLGHSFSKKYFTEKFEKMGLSDHQYELFEMENANNLMSLWDDPNLVGLNVTVPHKENVKPFLSKFDHSAEKVGAVNVIKKEKEGLVGYNSDYYGFKESLLKLIGKRFSVKRSLILGTGGASKAVKAALTDLGIEYQVVSRSKEKSELTYDHLKQDSLIFEQADLIINSTPLGTFPKVEVCPDLPYQSMHSGQYLYDLVYNPSVTLFMQKGLDAGAKVKNGLEMLELQAERSWEIWNS
ncbi:MAG: shikimate dehydrogenase [Cyclobacteriaceae bacterium]